MRNQKIMTDEMFQQFINDDKWISDIAHPVRCCDRLGNLMNYRTCTYPLEYIITEEQIAIAKERYAKRHDEVLASIRKGELVFCAMGSNYAPRFDRDVCNHRMRCYLKSTDGRMWFVELCRTAEHWEKQGYGFYYDYAYEVIDGEEHYEISPVFTAVQGSSFDGRINKPYAWENVLAEINHRFGCSYTSARLERYFVTYEEWVCEC